MRQKILVRKLVTRKPGTKTGKLYMELGIPEIEFKKIAEVKNDSRNQKGNCSRT